MRRMLAGLGLALLYAAPAGALTVTIENVEQRLRVDGFLIDAVAPGRQSIFFEEVVDLPALSAEAKLDDSVVTASASIQTERSADNRTGAGVLTTALSSNDETGLDSSILALAVYSFNLTVDRSATFDFNYAVESFGALSQVATTTDLLVFANGTQSIYAFDAAAGSLSFALAANTPYYFAVTAARDFFDFSGDPIVTGSSDLNLSFSYALSPAATAIPEPASWAMMIAGFCLIGTAARRRTSSATMAASRK